MRVFAIIPQKRLTLAKSRLAPAVDPGARAQLSLALLRRVCDVLRQAPAVEAVEVMTPDPAVRDHAAGWGVSSFPDPLPDLNSALGEVVARAGCAQRARAHRDRARRAMLVIAADLPWVSAADVAAIMRAAGPEMLVLAPSKDGTGTNALVMPPGVPFHPAFGPGSRAAHRRAAQRAGLRYVEICRPGLAFDVDLPEDLWAQDLPARDLLAEDLRVPRYNHG